MLLLLLLLFQLLELLFDRVNTLLGFRVLISEVVLYALLQRLDHLGHLALASGRRHTDGIEVVNEPNVEIDLVGRRRGRLVLLAALLLASETGKQTVLGRVLVRLLQDRICREALNRTGVVGLELRQLAGESRLGGICRVPHNRRRIEVADELQC